MFLMSNWRLLSLPTRAVLAKEFGFSKTGPTHVVDNRIESDGYKIEDVERALNVDAIQAYVESDSTDMNLLWDYMVAKAEQRLPTVFKPEVNDVKVDVVITPKPNCEFCATKGTRHLKTCTRPQ